jgi:hypothetical protein
MSRPIARHVEADAPTDEISDEEPLQVADAFDGAAVQTDDQVAGTHAGRRRGAAIEELHDLESAVAAQARSQRAGQHLRAADNPEDTPGEPGPRASARRGSVVSWRRSATAKPSPMPATAVLMPTTRARESASAPPELPG